MKFNKIVAFAAAAAITLGFAACSGNNANNSTEAEATSEEAVEDPAPEATAPAGHAVIELGADSLLKPADKPIVIDFNATWCGPCKQFGPIFHEVAESNSNFIFYSVDVDNCPQMAQAYEATSIPQVSILYPDGTIVKAAVGYMDKAEFEALLEKSAK